MGNANPFIIAFDTHTFLSAQAEPKDEEVQVPYKEVVGNLIYDMMMTRLDITYSINMVATYSEKPRNFH
jgi:hypothetical protein